MDLEKIATRIGFVLFVALVVGAALGLATANGGGATVSEPLTVDSHQPDAILADAPAETGDLSVTDEAGQKHVVVDAAHGNDLDRESIAPAIEALTAAGHTVSFHREDRETTLNESLRAADAFVVLSPERTYTASERAGLQAFADAGGRVLLAGEPPSQGVAIASLLGLPGETSAAPMTGLASSFGFAFGDGYVYDLESYDNNYRNVYAAPTGGASVGGDADQVTVHEATTVRGGTPLLETVETAKLSNDREAGSYAIASRNEDVVAIGDASVVNREWVQRNDNEVFVSGLLDFLVTGEKEPGAPAAAEPGGPGAPTRPPQTPS